MGIVIKVSTWLRRASSPVSARLTRLNPSNTNGLVTTATVSAPAFLAISAIIGAAPVPVPPPMPAVIKTMSGLPISLASSSRLSSTALAPTSGLAPAPSPLVVCLPI